MNMFCIKCGAKNGPNDRFCMKCGNPMNTSMGNGSQGIVKEDTSIKHTTNVTGNMNSDVNDKKVSTKKSKGLIVGIVVLIVAICAGAVAWLFLAGPLAAKDGEDKSSKGRKENNKNSEEQVSVSDDSDEQEENVDQQRKSREAIVQFIRDNLTRKVNYNDRVVYSFIDSVELPADTVYEPEYEEYCFFDGYQMVDVNDDGSDELLLHYAAEIDSYTFICSMDESGTVKVVEEAVADNQHESPMEYGSAAVTYKHKETGEKLTVLSGAIGSGAENGYFVQEVHPDLTVTEKFSYVGGIGSEPDSNFMVDGQSVTEEEYNKAVEDFQDEYECEEQYDYRPIINDLEEEFSVFAELEEAEEISEEQWKNAYSEFLAEYEYDSSYLEPQYELAYIDDDNVPELLIAEDGAHAASVSVYTYLFDTVYYIGDFGAYGTIGYAEKEGLIYTWNMGMGVTTEDLCTLSQGISEYLDGLTMIEEYDDATDSITCTYHHGKDSVTEEEYKQLQDSLFNQNDFTSVSYGDMKYISETISDTMLQTDSSSASDNSASSESAENSTENEPQDIATAVPNPTEEPDEVDYTGNTVLDLSSNVEVSSILGDQYGNDYVGANVLDNNNSTAWAEGDSGNGVGQTICLNLNQEDVVSAIGMVNGYGKSDSLYSKNCRVKSATVSFSDGSSQTITFSDGILTEQKVTITPVKTSYVQITINEVYAGDKYTDLCISEIKCYQ